MRSQETSADTATEQNEAQRVLTVKELADRLRIAMSSAYRLVRGGAVQSVRVGRVIRIPVEAVDQFLGVNEEVPEAPKSKNDGGPSVESGGQT